MKILIYTIVVFLILHCTLYIDNCICQWVQYEFIGGVSVYSFAVSGNNPEDSGQVIFAGTDNGVFLSTNNGQNWTQTALTYWSHSLAVSGNNPEDSGQVIFAGTINYGVYLSTNNGVTWTQTALNNRTVYSIAVSGNNIFAGTQGAGVYLSTNNGQNWTQTSLNNQTVRSLAFSVNNIFAGTAAGGVYFSANNGQNWTQTSLNNQWVYSLAISGNNIFAGTSQYGVYLSTDNGSTWTQTALNNRMVYGLAISGNNIFAGTNDYGVYLSTNNGQSWIQKNQGFPNIIDVYSLLIANNYIFAGTDGYSVWRRELAEIIGIQNISTEIPAAYSLEQNYPNPFNPVTKIRFAIPKNEIVTLKIFDLLGREAAILVNEKLQSGIYETTFDASMLPSGVYFYSLNAGDFKETKRMILVR